MILSICIPSYNHLSHLQDIIDSFSLSKSNECELVIVDNGSTEDISSVLHTEDPRIKIFKRKIVIKGPENMGSCIEFGTGKYRLLVIDKDFIDGHYGMPENERLFPIVQEAVQHKMKHQMEKDGVKKIRVHDLRHSHVAYLINKGIEPILIKERVGHKDIRITLNTYGHLYPNQQRKVADMLDFEKEKSPNSGNC